MTDTYASPLVERVATKDMIALWSPQKKFSTWRRCWVALAEAEQELGLPITDEQLDEMRAHVDDIDFEAARKFEEELRHDVMAHIHAYGAVAPRAKPIIHLGATSCYVGDNTDLILIREGLELLLGKRLTCFRGLRSSRGSGATCPRWATPITSPRKWLRWANGRVCGRRTSSWILKRSNRCSETCVAGA